MLFVNNILHTCEMLYFIYKKLIFSVKCVVICLELVYNMFCKNLTINKGGLSNGK